MTRKATAKPYWEMTTKELAEATREYDKEFVADKAKPLTTEMRARWERAKARRVSGPDGVHEQIIAVRLEPTLLARCTRLAKKKRISRDSLIARGLRALLAAEGEA
jgi:hypothetical protein